MSKKIRIISGFLLVVSLFMLFNGEKNTTIVTNAKVYADPPEASETLEGDMNKNGKIDLADVILLLKKYLGVDDDDPEEEQLIVPELKASVSIVGKMTPHVIHHNITCGNEDCSYDETVYLFETISNITTFTIDAKTYSESDVSGFEVYRKNGTEYTSVGSSNNVTGNVKIDTINGTYVVKVYKTKANNQTIYSEYSEELEISAPISAPGEGRFTYNFPSD